MSVWTDWRRRRNGRGGTTCGEAIEELLPTMEARYWAHQVDERHQVERRAFGGLMAQLNEPPEAPEG